MDQKWWILEAVTDFTFLEPKITADSGCSHKIKGHLLLGRKDMTNLDSILKSKDIILPTKGNIVKAMVFPVMTEWLHFHFSLPFIGEGNGNPLQCSCLENPRDGGAWWTAVCAVAQSQTRLKWLSSSSSMCRCESWTIEKVERWGINAFNLGC